MRAKQKHVEEVLKREEEAFNKTLDRGISRFNVAMLNGFTDELTSSGADKRYHFFFENDEGSGVGNVRDVQANLPEVRIRLQRPDVNVVMKTIGKMPVISGEAAFELYDTYGFPLDLTQLMARERGLTVDIEGFEVLMEQQRTRARMAQKKNLIAMIGDFPPTQFVGYDRLSTPARLLSIEGDYLAPGLQEYFAVIDRSPLYAEMGGQVGDQGKIIRQDGSYFDVVDTLKRRDTFFLKLGSQHTRSSIRPLNVAPPFVAVGGELVEVAVDESRRHAIERHHTVTHLLHWALHEVVSRDATQKGSYVGPEKLTFDFSSAALTKPQVREVEKLVNEKIAENAPVSWKEIPYAGSEAARRHHAVLRRQIR